ncbi:protein tantalus-like [Anastrepha obliqua]|uniref:protein tantalus-like n=1 Tax=Anastrepha obliqua TaxID=95512 RepID=UPI0024092802|nr:protein tantalus-like [Anastrepha obliqua]
MDCIVSGIAKISFQQNFEDILVENRTENMAARANDLTEAGSNVMIHGNNKDNIADSGSESELNISSEATTVEDVHSDSLYSTSTAMVSLSQRRTLPGRSCKDNILKLKRRTIMKPKRHNSRSCDFSVLRPSEIRKIYCNQKLTSFRPTSLETIFEEPQPEPRRGQAASVSSNTTLRFIGLKKIRRSLSFSDGLNTNKTLAKQRRAKIKKNFGRRSVCNKISLDDFIDRLNKSFGDDTDIDDAALDINTNNSPEEPMESDTSSTSVVAEHGNISTKYANATSTTKTEYEYTRERIQHALYCMPY